jgi:hypothetical protein
MAMIDSVRNLSGQEGGLAPALSKPAGVNHPS